MKKILSCLAAAIMLTAVSAQQPEIKQMVDSIAFIKGDSIDCHAALFWKIAGKGKEALPYLFDKLLDSTPTTLHDKCKLDPLTVGDVSLILINYIADFPPFVVFRIQFDVFTENKKGNLCWSFYDFAFANRSKQLIRERYMEWWDKEINHYKEKRIENRLCPERTKIVHWQWKDGN